MLSSNCEDKSITVTSGLLETETLKMNRLMVFNKIVKEDLKLLTSIFIILPWILLYLKHILNVRLLEEYITSRFQIAIGVKRIIITN